MNVTWHFCDVDDCSYKTKSASNLKTHQSHVHDINVVWHYCIDGCKFKAKEAGDLRRHQRSVHGFTSPTIRKVAVPNRAKPTPAKSRAQSRAAGKKRKAASTPQGQQAKASRQGSEAPTGQGAQSLKVEPGQPAPAPARSSRPRRKAAVNRRRFDDDYTSDIDSGAESGAEVGGPGRDLGSSSSRTGDNADPHGVPLDSDPYHSYVAASAIAAASGLFVPPRLPAPRGGAAHTAHRITKLQAAQIPRPPPPPGRPATNTTTTTQHCNAPDVPGQTTTTTTKTTPQHPSVMFKVTGRSSVVGLGVVGGGVGAVAMAGGGGVGLGADDGGRGQQTSNKLDAAEDLLALMGPGHAT